MTPDFGEFLYDFIETNLSHNEYFECQLCYDSCCKRSDKPDLHICEHCLPDPEDLPGTCCPKCGWNSEVKLGSEDAPVKYTNKHDDWEYGYCGGQHWTEVWTCPECNTVFEFDNSNV